MTSKVLDWSISVFLYESKLSHRVLGKLRYNFLVKMEFATLTHWDHTNLSLHPVKVSHSSLFVNWEGVIGFAHYSRVRSHWGGYMTVAISRLSWSNMNEEVKFVWCKLSWTTDNNGGWRFWKRNQELLSQDWLVGCLQRSFYVFRAENSTFRGSPRCLAWRRRELKSIKSGILIKILTFIH